MAVFVTWIHLVAAVVWFGGILFMVMVMVPVVRGALEPPMRGRFMAEIGRKFRNVTWASAAVLVITGVINISMRVAAGLSDIRAFMRLVTAKFAIVVVILAITALHDFVLAPRLASQSPSPPGGEGKGEGAALQRQQAMRRVSLLPRLSVLLGLVVMLLGLVLSHQH